VRGLSLETLLDLCAQLNITLAEFLRGQVAPGYRLARRHDPRRRTGGRPLPLLDDPQVGLRCSRAETPPRGSTPPGFAHHGVALVAGARALVLFIRPTGRPVLRPGEALLADGRGIASCRNLSDREAMLFWILRDDTGQPATAEAA
jgi:hypothetical protein